MEHICSLKLNNDFRRVYNKGKSFVSPGVVVYIGRNYKGCNRIGFTVAKKIGNAVQRNRARRVMREAFKQFAGRLKCSYDIVLVARSKTVILKSTDIKRYLDDLFEKAGMIAKTEILKEPEALIGNK